MSPTQTNESGRSMVEVLGVLAIVGILSIIGLHGYTKAMSKYHANELLNEAMKRATLVAGNLLSGGEIPETAGDQDSSGHTYSVSKNGDKQFTVAISGVDGDSCKLMKELAGAVIQETKCLDDSVELTFNNDLSTEGGENETEEDLGTPETRAYDNNQEGCEGAGYQYCADGKCITTEETCPDGSALCADQYPGTSEYNRGGYAGTIDEKTCRCPSEKVYSETDGCIIACSGHGSLNENDECICQLGYVGNVCELSCPKTASITDDSLHEGGSFFITTEEGDSLTCYCKTGKKYNTETGECDLDITTSCSSWTMNECGKGKYCWFKRFSADSVYSDSGICEDISECEIYDVNITVNGENKTLRAVGNTTRCSTNWWTAQAICASEGRHLISLSDLGCEKLDGYECRSYMSSCNSSFFTDLINSLENDTFPYWTVDSDSCPSYPHRYGIARVPVHGHVISYTDVNATTTQGVLCI